MATFREPCLRDLDQRGFIQGATIKFRNSGENICHYFGGIPYALPPLGPFRWRLPRPLPPCYRYGTRSSPGIFTGGTGVCPQSATLAGTTNDGPATLWDEDCLQLNIWVPAGKPPANGWPVFFYIHGGFLQVGSPNDINPVGLLSESPFRAIVVAPAYRLNLFGFLASRELQSAAEDEPTGNFGFWDQRLALEWTYKNISYFSGDASNITVGGYSAGSHSAFKQLAYDLYLPDSKAIIRRCVMWSNGPGMEPKTLSSAQSQFEELLERLEIPLSLPTVDKIGKLKSIPARQLLAAATGMTRHQFRATLDDVFIPFNLYAEIDSGAFGARMRARNVALMTGECRDEHFLYGTWYPPDNSLASVVQRLRADYPAPAVDALVAHYYPDGRLPADCADWRDAFGRIYADVQIHALERGFIDKLILGGAEDLVFRYRIEWRARCVDNFLPPEWGVTHSSDMPIWWWGNAGTPGPLGDDEKSIVEKAFVGIFATFVHGDLDKVRKEWGTKGYKEVRRLKADGGVDVWNDVMWEKGLKVWEALRRVGKAEAGNRGEVDEKAKL
ncbi:putative carboxylesterase [Phyllosticta capitalensis]|uniref:Carboxylesterase n=1 Tax=Phyllosticta capitalensis TaxID=121624 RepID=A0ABR1Z0Y1_9PEZI